MSSKIKILAKVDVVNVKVYLERRRHKSRLIYKLKRNQLPV